MKDIVVVHTGCSNLFSIASAVRRVGHSVVVTRSVSRIIRAKKIFLPGVGTVQSMMHRLRKSNLIDAIRDATQPVLGICLGMQVLGKRSDENPRIDTFGVLPQTVRRIDGSTLPIPHMGWNQIFFRKKSSLFNRIRNGSYFYFAHSYAFPVGRYTLAQFDYGGRFGCVVRRKNFFGVQFHPERSGSVGEQMIQNFLEM